MVSLCVEIIGAIHMSGQCFFLKTVAIIPLYLVSASMVYEEIVNRLVGSSFCYHGNKPDAPMIVLL